ncbi:uncharacterized protein LOC127150160 isoform X2 [Cucumis melo]|uniref:Uncharacterized protein LOC127150160 isoform X2 n=1 Tax=Cucumis melo TaxID=3656 RepID=A0ABM3KZ26_CUCME|nr:uncharacterized protein LOC127150160 isoform X2 [Cucumis melo]
MGKRMAQLEEVVSTVKTNNHLVAAEPSVNLGNVYDEICNLVSEVRIIAAKQTDEERSNKSSMFFACEPPSFGEDTDPLVAQRWILILENIFDLIRCSDKQKVSFASLRLKDAAFSWWMVLHTDLEADGVTVTWEKLKELFEKRYLPRWLKLEKFRELCNLEQGDGTVAEYDEQFIKLASLAHEFIPDEAWEARLFGDGLRADIRAQICFSNNVSYAEVRNLALMEEQRINK